MMNTVGEREIRTQERVIAFFEDTLGYTYLGNWEHSGEENSNILSEDPCRLAPKARIQNRHHQQSSL